MSHGLIIYNQDGEILVHSDHEMAHLHSEQDFSTSEGRMTQTLSFSGLNNQPITMASVIDGQPCSITCRAWKSATLWDRVDARVASGTLAKTIRVWIFARGEGGQTTGYGIKAYKEDGVLSFDSSRKMTRYHAGFSGSVAIGTVANHDFPELAYPPPIALNRRFISAWWADPALYIRLLHWKLIKNASDLYYRLEIGLSDIRIGSVSATGGYKPSPIAYSGFIFKYK